MQAECHSVETGAMKVTTKHPKLLFCMLKGLSYEADEVLVLDDQNVVLSERLYHELLRYQSGIPTPPTSKEQQPSIVLRRQTGVKRHRDKGTQTESTVRNSVCVGVQTEQQQVSKVQSTTVDDDDILGTVYLRSHDTLPAAVMTLEQPPPPPSAREDQAGISRRQEEEEEEDVDMDVMTTGIRALPPPPPSSIASGMSNVMKIQTVRKRLLGFIS